MRLLHVIPISRAIGRETLSYFSLTDIRLGSVISVPLRKRTVPALVIGSDMVRDSKAAIKGSPWQIRKVKRAKARELFSPAFVEAAKRAAAWSATTTGAVFAHTLPQAIFSLSSGTPPGTLPAKKSPEHGDLVTPKLVFQAEEKERFIRYRSLIREEFARGVSVFFCVPTIPDAEFAAHILSKGIEPYCFLFHGSLSKQDIAKRWKEAVAMHHPLLIIATPSFLSLPRGDLGTIVLERERSRSYKLKTRPFLDTRMLAEFLAEELGSRLIMADFPLRVETLFRHKAGELDELTTLRMRLAEGPETVLIDMRQRSHPGTKVLEVLSPELKEMLALAQTEKKKAFIFY